MPEELRDRTKFGIKIMVVLKGGQVRTSRNAHEFNWGNFTGDGKIVGWKYAKVPAGSWRPWRTEVNRRYNSILRAERTTHPYPFGVEANTMVQIMLRRGNTPWSRYAHNSMDTSRADTYRWGHTGGHDDITYFRIYDDVYQVEREVASD